MSLARFLREAQQLEHHLDMHHKIVSFLHDKSRKELICCLSGGPQEGTGRKPH